MTKYSDVPFLANMIDALGDEIMQLERDMNDSDQPLKRKYMRVITVLNQSRAMYCARRSILIEELEAIKSDNPDVYSMIYWHDLKRLSWEQTFNKTCGGLWSECPQFYCRNVVSRYLKKKGYEEQPEVK